MRTVQLVLFLAVLFCSCIVGIVYFEGEGVRRLEVQSLHYFARPHTSIATESIKGPSIWVGSELEKQPEKWKEHLSSEHIKDIENTITKASKESNLNLSSEIDEDELAARLSPLSKEQCPFGPLMTEAIARWKNKLSVTDIGFRVISGVPTQNWTATKSSLFFWCVGLHLGRTGAQNNDGHVLGHVRDIGGDHHKERQFKSKGNIAFHCDTADVVGLLALSKPMEGGTSRLISSGTVYNEFLAQRPDLVPELYKITALDTRGSGGVDYVWIRPLRYFDGVLRTFWHEEYFATALNLPNGPNQTEVQREAHEVYSSIIARDDLWLDMELEVGDIQLVSNHAVLHARAAFTDYPKEEDEKLGVDRRRHLLRLWLSIEPPSGLWERLLKEMSRLEVLYWLIEAKIRNL